MMQLKAGGVVYGLRLLLDRIDDFLAAVAGVYGPQTGDAVEHLAAVLRQIVHVLGGHQQARRRLELAVGREWHPQPFPIWRIVQLASHLLVWHVYGGGRLWDCHDRGG